MKAANLNSDNMLKTMVVEAVKQQKQIRSTVRDPTLKALPARELGLSQIDNVVRNVGMAADCSKAYVPICRRRRRSRK